MLALLLTKFRLIKLDQTQFEVNRVNGFDRVRQSNSHKIVRGCSCMLRKI